MEDLNLLQSVTAKAQTWLGEGYDEETKAEVKKMLENEDKDGMCEMMKISTQRREKFDKPKVNE